MADDAGHATLGPAAPKPEHIPDSLVYDFDLFMDPGLLADPHDRVQQLLAEAPPLFWTPRGGGHWVALGHEANFEISRDWETFSSAKFPEEVIGPMLAAMEQSIGRVPMPVPINVDPPVHGAFRLPLNKAFGPKAINELKTDIRALAAQLIDKVKDSGHCEFMTEIGEPMPVQVFLKMMGLPLDRQAEYRELVRRQLAAAANPDLMVGIKVMQEVTAIMRPVLLERRDHPQSDLISLIWQSKVDGRDMTIKDLENYGVLMFIAGLDTVMNGMGYGVRHLAQNLELQARLRANPAEIGEATEELLRRYTFTVPTRRVAKDTVFLGVDMRAGDRLVLLLGGADLDPKRFTDPGKFDIDREDKVHVAFGVGPHRCLGSHLARVELQILYEELLARLPPFRLDPDSRPVFHGGNVIGIDELKIVWDA